MKNGFLKILIAAAVLVLVFAAIPLVSAANDDPDMKISMDFNNEATYLPLVVYNSGAISAGNSTTMGYKGWIDSKNKAATSVFRIESKIGIAFREVLFIYKAYSIGSAASDKYDIYFSADGENFASLKKYDESKWTLVSAVRNDPELAGTGVYVADPRNVSEKLDRTVNLSELADGLTSFYIRVDCYRGENIDGVPSTYGGAFRVLANYAGSDTPSILPDETTAEVTEATTAVTTAADTSEAGTHEPDTSVTSAPEVTTTAAPAERGCASFGCFGQKPDEPEKTSDTPDVTSETTPDVTSAKPDEPDEPIKVSADDIPEIAGGAKCVVYDCGDGQIMRHATGVFPDEFAEYIECVKAAGYSLKSQSSLGKCEFREFEKDGKGLWVYHSSADASLRAIAYPLPSFHAENSSDRSHDLLFTQVQNNFTVQINGMSYIIRTEAGSFIVIDGGWIGQGEAKKILGLLEEQNENGGKPVVAAWILTHPHSDHIGAIAEFSQLYDDRIVLERLVYNFVNDEIFLASDAAALLSDGTGAYKTLRSSVASTRKEWHNAEIIKPHTGQVLDIDGVKIQILHTHEDNITNLSGMNAASLIFRMELGSTGKSALFLGDLSSQGLMKDVYNRYGSFLKSDILQPQHHGSTGGRVDLYAAVAPSVCFYCACNARMEEYANAEDSDGKKYNVWIKENVPEIYVSENGTVTLNLTKNK